VSREAEGSVFQVLEDVGRVDCIVNTIDDLEKAVAELKSRGLTGESTIKFYLGVNPVIAPVVWARTPKI